MKNSTVGEDGKIKGSKVRYHSVRALEAIRWAEKVASHNLDGPTVGQMLDELVYDHARGAATAALNGQGRKR